MVPVVLIVWWLNLTSDDSLYLLTKAIWAIMTLVAVSVCALFGLTARASDATQLWMT